MTPDEAREIAIREVAVKVREIADTCERWRVNDHGYVPIAHELREAAAVLEAQANVEESRSVNRHAEVSRFYGDANRDASASESEAGTPQHIQANVEEKKAAFLEAARAEAAYRLSIFPPPIHPTKYLHERLRNFDLAYRALVESEKESASKKEDDGT